MTTQPLDPDIDATQTSSGQNADMCCHLHALHVHCIACTVTAWQPMDAVNLADEMEIQKIEQLFTIHHAKEGNNMTINS